MAILNMVWVPGKWWWEADLNNAIEYINKQWRESFILYKYDYWAYNWNNANYVARPNALVFDWRTVLWVCWCFVQNRNGWYRIVAEALWYKDWVIRHLASSWWSSKTGRDCERGVADGYLYWKDVYYWSTTQYNYYKFNFENNSVDRYYDSATDSTTPPWYQTASTSWNWSRSTQITIWETTKTFSISYNWTWWVHWLWTLD